MAVALNSDPPDRADLIRLVAVLNILLPTAERIDGEIIDEAFLVDLFELRDRAESALRPYSER